MENYFEWYEIPLSFRPDKELVKKKFYELSRKFHPDRFSNAGKESLEEALRMSAMNNQAYKILNDEDALMAYVLKLNGLLEEEEKYSLPADFLMEMMELNEAVSDFEAGEGSEQLAVGSWQEQVDQWQEEMKPLVEKFESGDQSRQLLSGIKDFYFRKKYLLRIQERINKFAAP